MTRLRIPFEAAAPDADESPLDNESPDARAMRLAEKKARSLESQFADALIIGGDQTIADIGGDIYGKPHTPENAVAQLLKMRGRDLNFYTAICVSNPQKSRRRNRLITHRVTMRLAADAEIRRYVKCEPSLNCAGGAQLEGLGISLIREIQGGDPTALIGLPLIALCDLLRAEGISLP